MTTRSDTATLRTDELVNRVGGGLNGAIPWMFVELARQLERDLAAATQRAEQDAKDAQRYRWLRDAGHIKSFCKGDEVDRIVDAEMAKPPKECPF